MIVERALAKVNLALHVLGRRADGYHILDSVVGFADVADVISVELSSVNDFQITGPFASLLPQDESNLVLKTVAAVRKYIEVPPLAISLVKNLPVAGGIGGGSADAAAVLRALQKFVSNPLPSQVLHDVALSLGADVPVCLAQRSSRMRGIGEVVEILPAPPAAAILLVNPIVPCLTSAVFQELGLAPNENYRDGVTLENQMQWRNDLYAPALQVQPVIADVLQALESTGACQTVRMSGSGATCFGLTDSLEQAQKAAEILSQHRPHWWVVAAKLQ